MYALMVSEARLAPEAFPTCAALKRLFPCVDPLVLLQVADLSKTLSAFGTLVWLLSRMHVHVSSETRVLPEALPTYSAVIRLLPSVDPLVDLQMIGPPEGFSTLGTLMGLLSSMCELMDGQSVTSPESLPTCIALMRIMLGRIATMAATGLFTSMADHMVF